VLLSVCIPTHHGRAEKLERLLDGLVPQLEADERVELCVSDNASEDATNEVIARVSARLGNRVRYQRHPVNRGFTPNLVAAVELASAKWCWFLGSDDLVSPTAVADITALVERYPEAAGGTLYRTQAHHDDAGKERRVDPASLLPNVPEREREVLGEDAIVRNLAQLQDFISTQVVDRGLWQEVVASLGEAGLVRGRLYPHLLVIGMMVRSRPRWFWFPRETVLQHIGATAVYEHETGYDPADYEVRILRDRALIWAELHGRSSPLYRAALRRTWHRHFEVRDILGIKLHPGTRPPNELALLGEAVRDFWWLPRFWATTFLILVIPSAVWRLIQRPILLARTIRSR